jgi:hypothetical protein
MKILSSDKPYQPHFNFSLNRTAKEKEQQIQTNAFNQSANINRLNMIISNLQCQTIENLTDKYIFLNSYSTLVFLILYN